MNGNNNRLPTTTYHQARLQVFQATTRPKHQERSIDVPYGKAVIVGCLGQTHASLLECLFFYAESASKISEGRISITINPYKIRTCLGDKGKPYSYETFNRHMNDLMAAIIEIHTFRSTDIHIVKSHIIEKVTILQETKEPSNLVFIRNAPKYKYMWSVIISKEFMELMRKDYPLYYDPVPITKLRSGIAQAVVRFVRTQSRKHEPKGGWFVKNMISLVWSGSPSLLRDRIRELNDPSEKIKLQALGILIDGEKIKRI